MKLFNLFFVAAVAALSFGLVYAVEPSDWDGSSISVSGECDNARASFNITNNGYDDMSDVSEWYFVQKQGGASSCAADVAAGYTLSGTFLLEMGATTYATIKTWEYAPPYRLCVAQRPGHPGTGWASATVDATCGMPTVIEIIDEPITVSKLFLPILLGD